MKRTLILIHLALSIAFIGNSISMKAQTKDTIQSSCVLRYYASLEDIKNDHWTEIILKDSTSTIHKNNEGNLIDDRNFIIKDKAVRKIINKKAIAIKCDSTILLNLRFIRCKGSIGSMGRDFARAYPLKDGRFIMAYYDVKKVGGLQGMGAMGGLIGAVVMSSSMENLRNNNVCYLFTPEKNMVVRVKNDILKELLAGHDDLIDEYNNLDRNLRNFENIIIPLLKRANALK